MKPKMATMIQSVRFWRQPRRSALVTWAGHCSGVAVHVGSAGGYVAGGACGGGPGGPIGGAGGPSIEPLTSGACAVG